LLSSIHPGRKRRRVRGRGGLASDPCGHGQGCREGLRRQGARRYVRLSDRGRFRSAHDSRLCRSRECPRVRPCVRGGDCASERARAR